MQQYSEKNLRISEAKYKTIWSKTKAQKPHRFTLQDWINLISGKATKLALFHACSEL